MMVSAVLNDFHSFDNILYIGEESKTCLSLIEKFNDRLLEIEHHYKKWFANRHPKSGLAGPDKLQYHIQYHFEGGIAAFKFKDAEELPFSLRKECLVACKMLQQAN
jgi:hypothetical protein